MYNAYNIPISNLGLLFKTGMLSHMSRIWMPSIILAFFYKKLKKQYDEWFGLDTKKEMVGDWSVLRMRNKINNLYPLLYYSVIYDNSQKTKELYKKHFGNYPESDEDLTRIVDRIEKLKDQLGVVESKENKDDDYISFSRLIAIVEDSKGIQIDRKMTLYDFYELYQNEMAKWQRNQ